MNFKTKKDKRFDSRSPRNDDYKMESAPASKSAVETVDNHNSFSIIKRNIKDIKFETISATGFDNISTLSSNPYPMFGKLNSIVDINYGSSQNDLAANAVEYNSFSNSILTRSWDVIRLQADMNYNTIANNGYLPRLALETQARAFNEVLTAARLENYSQLDIISNLDSTNHSNHSGDYYFTTGYTLSGSEVPNIHMMGFLNSYQSAVTNLCLIPALYNYVRSLGSYLTTMCYDNGDLALSALFKLLDKKTNTDIYANINLLLRRLYVDQKWFDVMTKVLLPVSRRADEVLSPLMTITGINRVIPSRFRLRVDGDGNNDINLMNIDYSQTISTYHSIDDFTAHSRTKDSVIRDIITLLSPYNLVRWARSYHQGNHKVNPEQYVNYLNGLVQDFFNAEADSLTPTQALNDLLEMNDRLGLNNWTKGSTFDFSNKPVQITPTYNKFVEDVIKASKSGSSTIRFRHDFMDWNFTTLWNRKTGIASFDIYRGGLAVTGSFRDVLQEHGHDGWNDYQPLPIMFTNPTGCDDYCLTLLNGISQEVTLQSINIPINQLSHLTNICRLNPTNQTSEVYNTTVPVIQTSDIPTEGNPAQINPLSQSILFNTIQSVFGMFIATNTHQDLTDTDWINNRTNYYDVIDKDAFSLITVRTDSFKYEVINTFRATGPIKVPVSPITPTYIPKL